MARNIRNISVSSFMVRFAYVEGTELKQDFAVCDSSARSRQIKQIAKSLNLKPEDIIIISAEKTDKTYRIKDIAYAMYVLEDKGLAEIVENVDELEEEEEEE